MWVATVKIRDFRIIDTTEFAPGVGVNLIAGPNGAGKTSVIEALYVAGRGQSFRHREIRPWIREGAKSALIVVETVGGDGRRHRIGLEQGRGGRQIRLDGKDLQRRSQQVQALPLQLITPSSHDLIEKGPGVRRRFLDWGLFHVEPKFHGHAVEYRRLLQQRNAALRSGDRSYPAWDPQLGRLGEAVEAARRAVLPAIEAATRNELANFGHDYRLELHLRSNWDGEVGLEQSLKRSATTDLKLGHTGSGPHRSQLDVLVDGVSAERRLSRGQQKVLVYALVFGLVNLARELSGEAPVILIDDLPAELDRDNRLRVMQRLLTLGIQAFVTGIEFDPAIESMALTRFHVEHGHLTESATG
jgi:DNA replication and repair protein RecF